MRLIALVAALSTALIGTAVPVAAGDVPAVEGRGFMRVPDANAKLALKIEATDTGVVGDKGSARFLQREQGQGSPVEIVLDCVNVVENTAMASGMGDDGNLYLFMVRDNAQGSGSRDEFGVLGTPGATAYCASGVIPVPSAFRMGTIDRGNFVVGV